MRGFVVSASQEYHPAGRDVWPHKLAKRAGLILCSLWSKGFREEILQTQEENKRSSCTGRAGAMSPPSLSMEYRTSNSCQFPSRDFIAPPPLSVNHQLGHGIMFAVARPQRGLAVNGRGGDEGIGDFNAVAAGIAPHQFAGTPSDRFIDGRALDEREELLDCSHLRWPGSRFDFGDADWARQHLNIRGSEFGPLRKNKVISPSEDFDDDVGVEQDRHLSPRRSMRVYARRRRTMVSVSSRSVRSFQRPTMPIIASRRFSRLPR